MFSIRNNDELRFRSSVGKMEDNELEEGEAVSCHDDEFFDPDAAFSYIDEKLQDILGHSRKDFEGEVSAENLGSKFGQYGSFLPTHPRSPAISSQHKSPLNPPNPTVSKSPFNLSPKKPPVSSGTPPITNRCAPYVDSNKFKSVINGSDRKSLKVRIRLGPNNTLTRSNASIHSSLGLDTSPSSSPEDSPEACQGLPPRTRDAPGESSSNILQAMTSFSVPGGCLLSPLSAHLLQWTENEFSNNRKADGRVESSAVPIKETENYLENDEKLSLQKDRVMEEDNLDYKTNTSRKLKNKIHANASSSNQAVSNSLDMPLKSCSRKAIPKAERLIGSNSVKDFDKPSSPFDNISKHTMPKKTSLPNSAEVVDQVELKRTAKIASSKGKLVSRSRLSEKEIKETNSSRHKDALSNTQKGENNMNQKIIRKSTVEHKGSYARGSNASEPSKPMSALKGVSCDRHAKTMLQRIDKNQESKIKQKRNHNDGTPSKELFQTNSPKKIPSNVMSDGKKKSSHSTGEDDKSNTSISRKLTKKRYLKPSVGNVDAQGVENTRTLSDKIPEKKKNACIHPEPPESSAIDSNLDAAAALTTPAIINDNWVCCDKCEEWRLLPYEQDPDNLPKEWLCKMQYWLPGLNKCYISQDVTTKAFNERFPVPAPAPATEAGSEFNGHHDINPANNIQLSDRVLDQDTKAFSNIGVKKAGLSALNANKTLKLKRKLQSDKTDSSNRPLGTNSSSKAVPCKLTDLNTDKHIHKFNEKLQSQGPYSDREELAEKSSRVLKSNSKRESSQEEFKPPKKIKKEISDTDYKLESVVARASSGLQMKIAGKIMRKNSDHTSKESKCEIDGKPSAFIRKSIDTNLIGNHKDKPNYEKSDIYEYAAKKRKVKEWQESQQAQKETVTTAKKHTLYAKECLPEGEPVPQKKTKSSNFEKGSSTNISNEKEGKSDGSTKNLLPTTAATSSSSKVSSSRKRRVGSPVESVSSSPLRTSSANKFSIRSCKDMVNTDSCLMKSRNRCPEGEVGSDQSGVQIKETDNFVSYIKMTEESLDEPFSKKEAKSHPLNAECDEINDIAGVKKDYNSSEGRHKVNIHNHSNGNSNYMNSDKDANRRTLKPHVNCSIITEAQDSDGKKIGLSVKNNGRSYHNESFLSHELLKDDKKSDTLMSHQSTLNIIGNKSENIMVDKKIPSELIQSSKDKCEAQSSDSQVVVHNTPPNNDATNSHELIFTKQSQTPESHGGMHLNSNNNSQKVNGRECGLMNAADAVIKNARGLKHTANHMKSDGKRHESIEFYFEAALQFLRGSFLMEPLNENATTYKESNQVIAMMNLYFDTAKLFEYCAHEYETFNEMVSVALAFKCVEVAYMKVAYYKHATANKDRLELRTSLQMVLPGESPSSSASDVDNLNNNGAVDKIISAKAANSPQIAGNHIIAARHRPNFLRLLEYAEYSNRAFDAMKRYQNAISAASVGMEKDGVDRLVSVRQALDVNFHNIEKLLQFIRNSRVNQSLIT